MSQKLMFPEHTLWGRLIYRERSAYKALLDSPGRQDTTFVNTKYKYKYKYKFRYWLGRKLNNLPGEASNFPIKSISWDEGKLWAAKSLGLRDATARWWFFFLLQNLEIIIFPKYKHKKKKIQIQKRCHRQMKFFFSKIMKYKFLQNTQIEKQWKTKEVPSA